MQKAVPFARARRAREFGSCRRPVNLAHRTCLADDMADLAAQDGKAVLFAPEAEFTMAALGRDVRLTGF